MKIIAEVGDPCDCVTKILRFLAVRQQAGFRALGPGSVIECECEKSWTLVEDQNIRQWIEMTEGYGK